MAQDWHGIPFSTIPEPTHPDFTFRLRNMFSVLDAWARDQSQGMARITVGQVPNGSGGPIAPPAVDLSQYFFLPGRSNDQVGYGSIDASGALTLSSTIHATKGFIYLGSSQEQLVVDEAQSLYGFNIAEPDATVHIVGSLTGSAGSTLTTTSPVIDDGWGGSRSGAGGGGIGDATYVSLASNDDITSYVAAQPPFIGTNPFKNKLNGTIQPGATYRVTLRIAPFSGTFVPTATNSCFMVTLIDSAGEAWQSDNQNAFNGTNHPWQGSEISTTTQEFRTITRVITCAGTAASTGNTANAVWVSAQMRDVADSGIYCCVSYIAVDLVQAPLLRWDLSSGALSGQVDSTGRMGVGTVASALAAELTLVPDAASTVAQLINAGSTQTANLLNIVSAVSGNATFEVDSKAFLKASLKTSGFLVDSSDLTKKAAFDASGITTATTRTYGLPNLSGRMAIVGDDPPAVASGSLGKVDLTGQTANIASTAITNSPPAGLYQVMLYVSCTTASGSGSPSLDVNFAWTDVLGATNRNVNDGLFGPTAFPISLSATGREQAMAVLQLASGNISFSTTINGASGTPQYAIYIRVISLG